MPTNFEELQFEALKLAPAQRRRLAEMLLASLDPGNSAESENAALALAEKRYEDYLAGKLEVIPAEQAFKDVAAQLSSTTPP